MYHVLPTLSYQSRVHAIARTSIILFGVEGLVEVDNVLNRLSHFKKKLISRLVKIDFTLSNGDRDLEGLVVAGGGFSG